MKVYVINQMQYFMAYVDAEGIHIEKDNNVNLEINTRYIALLIKFASMYNDLDKLYNVLSKELEFDYANVLRITSDWLVAC